MAEKRVSGPWNNNEVYKIKLVQENPEMKPHVCPVHDNRALIVTPSFLFCIECGYQQKWVSSRLCRRKSNDDEKI